MSDQYWEIVEYECQDGKCLMIHNIPNDSKLGALSLDYRDIGEAIVDKLNEQLSIIHRDKISIKTMMSNMEKLEEENEQLKKKLESLQKVLHLVEVIDDE